jgi:hypothetical protein
MISRVSGVGIALLALLTAAPVCFAQEPVLPPVPAAKVDSLAPAKPVVVVKPTPTQLIKRGSFGGFIGWGSFLADGDYSHSRSESGGYDGRDTRSRPGFQATFRYQMSEHFRWQISPGYTWAGYTKDSPLPFTDPNFPADSTKEQVLTQLLPISVQLQYTLFRKGGWVYHAGVGPGVYRVWVQNRRKVLADPVTYVRHSGFYPGMSGEIGAARMLRSLPSVSLEGTIDGHWVFAERDDQFPSGFNSYLYAMEAKFGASYHFDTSRFFKGGKQAPAPAPPAGH